MSMKLARMPPNRMHWTFNAHKVKNFDREPYTTTIGWCYDPCGCADCETDILGMIQLGHITVTSELMHELPARLRDEVVKAICLRQVRGG